MRTYNTLIICFLITLYSSVAFSQKVSGVVVSRSGKGLSGIHIASNHEPSIKCISANDGSYSMNLPIGIHQLTATAIGYKPWQRTIQLALSDTLVIPIVLDDSTIMMPSVEILGNKGGSFKDIPGSLTRIEPYEIQRLQSVSGNEVMRQSPGIHVVDEEGLGLRTNIGIRGLDPDRSRTVLMLEDGVPVALGPYGEPEMYYTPAIERMDAVEILKGSGSLLYGPQTIGGVINYRTMDPPEKLAGVIRSTTGPGGFFSFFAGAGNTYGTSGLQFNFLRKQSDALGTNKLRLNDFSMKWKLKTGEHSKMGVKLGIYDEWSNATYIGITQAMYDQGENDFSVLAPYDRLNIRRYSASLQYDKDFSDHIQLSWITFAYTTERNWQRQDFAYNSFDTTGALNPKPADYSGITWGDETIAGGALYMRNSTGNRNRSFFVVGSEPRLQIAIKTGKLQHHSTVGIRYLREQAFEQRINGTQPDASSGALVEDEIRTGNGYSAFIQDRLTIGHQISITGGIRFERFDYERDIRRNKFVVNGVNEIRDTMLIAENSIIAWIPGIGVNLQLAKETHLFAGVHRGFAPPRIKDAISSTGTAYALDAEWSWNYEIGIRTSPFPCLDLELTGYTMDFENQIIPVSESSGGIGTGLVNGGSTLHKGVEMAVTFRSQDWKSTRYHLEIQMSGAHNVSTFNTDRFISVDDERVNINGNATPYAPRWQASGGLYFNTPFHLQISAQFHHTGSQFADQLNTVDPTADGRIGKLQAFQTFDAGIKYRMEKQRLSVRACMKNLTDERYITSRRPQGIRVGLPRMLFVGLDLQF